MKIVIATTTMSLMAAAFLINGTPALAKNHKEGCSAKRECAKKKAEAKEEVQMQTKCPVMGGKINKDLYVDANGKRIYVCCKGCIGKVKENPEKYIKKLEKQGVTLVQPQQNCPVMGGKINKDLYVDANGKRIYVCCKGCIGKVKENPEKYVKKLEEQGVTIARVDEKGNAAVCPMTKDCLKGKCPVKAKKDGECPMKKECPADEKMEGHKGHDHK